MTEEFSVWRYNILLAACSMLVFFFFGLSYINIEDGNDMFL